jgi:hypothetical protein
MNDIVNNPSHYTQGSIECIDAIQASMSAEAFEGYCKGNAMKYIWRYKHKGKALEDLQKAQWYLDKLVSVQEHPMAATEPKKRMPFDYVDDKPPEKTYRDVVAEKWPEMLPNLSCKCPDRYFRDAYSGPCDCSDDCKRCWSQPYRGEEIIYGGVQDEKK